MKKRTWLLLILAVLFSPYVYSGEVKMNLLPKPQSVEFSQGWFKHTKVKLTGNIISTEWEELLSELGFKFSDKASATISLNLVDKLPNMDLNSNEGYQLSITKKEIKLDAETERGMYWGIQTLRQLVNDKGAYKTCSIVDWPAFRIRGFMQDVGRSYMSIAELKREIAQLAKYKINTFHWHLTENQAWRLESKMYPQLNDSVNMTRMPGSYYTWDEVRDLVEFCKQHHVLLIPEVDMPGHSAAFDRTFGFNMQSEEGMAVLKDLLDEICVLFDVPYLHIGTDEVGFTNPEFVPEMVKYIRAKGMKVISWNPGWNYAPGEIDMTQLWSYRGKAQPGIPAIDSKFHYINHFDTFADIFALYTSKIYNVDQGSDDIAGTIIALWHDRVLDKEENIILENHFYPNMLALAERSWLGGGYQYFDDMGTVIPTTDTEEFKAFADFERRMLWHKEKFFSGFPFAYVKQTNIEWNITDAFPNEGDLTKAFPPEQELASSYTYKDKTYEVNQARGAGVYLRHVWGEFVPGFYAKPEPYHTAYAYTWVYSPINQEVGLWAEFQNYSRSEMDLPPAQGKWDYKESRIWINDSEIAPPVWTATHKIKSNEIPLGNENMVARSPIKVKLNKGWNKVFLKLPVANFSQSEIRLVKWMFSTVFVTLDGEKAIDNLIYSADKTK